MADPLALLDQDWEAFCRSMQGRKALHCWHLAGVATDAADVDDLLDRLRHDTDMDRRDGLMMQLLTVGRGDADARRVVLQAVVPGLAGVTRAYSRRWGWNEAGDMVVTAAIERIGTYPLGRTSLPAANIVRDVRHQLYLTRLREVAREAVLNAEPLPEHLTSPPPQLSPSDELLAVVAGAVDNGCITAEAARVVVLSRVYDVSSETLAAPAGVTPGHMRRRRLRAEARIAEAVEDLPLFELEVA
ncbi:MAG: hypothetical protein HYU28_07715 [Actinobacteria bacterium]|nr:hypothetical protein [Actinomycetota bacterium]